MLFVTAVISSSKAAPKIFTVFLKVVSRAASDWTVCLFKRNQRAQRLPKFVPRLVEPVSAAFITRFEDFFRALRRAVTQAMVVCASKALTPAFSLSKSPGKRTYFWKVSSLRGSSSFVCFMPQPHGKHYSLRMRLSPLNEPVLAGIVGVFFINKINSGQ